MNLNAQISTRSSRQGPVGGTVATVVTCSPPKPATAFTLIEIMIVVSIIGMLAAIAIPCYVHARSNSWQNACINNLRQIDGAKQMWSLEHQVDPMSTPVDSNLLPYLGRGNSGSLPWCPADTNETFDTSYSANNLQLPPTCLILPSNHIYN